MNKILLFLLGLIFINQFIKAQDPKESYTLNAEVTGDKTYIARDYISLKNGFSYTADGKESFTASVNNLLEFAPTNTKYKTASGVISGDSRSGGVVGTLPGSYDVSSSGAATYNIPIQCAPGTAGMTPSISINYNSQAGFGELGKSWFLNATSVISVAAKTKYFDGENASVSFDDMRYQLDGNRLIAMTGVENQSKAQGQTYKTEFNNFSKVSAFGDGEKVSHFIIETKSGHLLEYGNTSDSKLVNNNNCIKWFLKRDTDPYGNYISYEYDNNHTLGEVRLVKIKYTGSSSIQPYCEVRFAYQDITDVRKSYLAGVLISQSSVLKEISTYSEGKKVYTYEFKYNIATRDGQTRLLQVNQIGRNTESYNPTVINWGDDQWVSHSCYMDGIFDSNDFEYVGSGDFNGDGLNEYFLRDKESEELQFYRYSQVDDKIEHATSLKYAKSYYNNKTYPSNVIVVDINKDGKDDLLEYSIFEERSSQEFWNLIRIWISEGNDEFTPLKTFVTRAIFSDLGRTGQEKNGVEFSLGDFDGNGMTDILCINTTSSSETENTPWKLYAYSENELTGLKCINSGVMHAAHSYTKVNESDGNLDLENKLLSNDNTKFADFNGDGCTDIIYNDDNDICHIIEYKNGQFKELFSLLDLKYKDIHQLIDENSDGLSDIVAGKNIYYGTGYGFIKTENVGEIDSRYTKKGLDFDGNGISDVTYLTYDGSTSHFLIYALLNRYNLDDERLLLASFSNDEVKSPSCEYNYDYDGDGTKDLFITLGNNVEGTPDFVKRFLIVFNQAYNKAQRVSSITDGLGNTVSFNYLPMTNTDVYTKGTGCEYPYQDIIDSRYLVQSIQTPNAIGSYNKNYYRYTGFRYNVENRRSLGFTQITKTDSVSGFITENIYDYNTTYLFPYLKKSATYDLKSNRISQNWYYNNVKEYTGRCIFPYVRGIDQTNYLLGTELAIEMEIDEYGNQISMTKDYRTDGVRNTITNSFVKAGSWIPSKLASTTTKTEIRGGDDSSQKTDYIYTTEGNVERITSGVGADKSVVTEYTYNSFGLPTKVTVSGSDVEDDRYTKYEYDSKGRFVTKTTNILGQFVTRENDEATGNVLVERDINGLETRYSYDGLGRLVHTILPNGITSVNSLLWSDRTDIPNATYYSYSKASNSAAVKVYYNKLGMPIQTEGVGFNGDAIISTKEYNNKGQLVYESSPHYTSDSDILSKNYTYDAYGRLLTATGTTSDIEILYDDLTKTVISDGQSKTYTFNGLGQLVSSKDDGGEMTYIYNSLGKPISVSGAGQITEMKYDEFGNQTYMNEPNSGTFKYTYNAFGELLSQDKNGVKTTVTYDKLGRVSTVTETEGTITYTYDTRSNGKGMLSSVVNSNGNGKACYYDSYGRLSSLTETIDSRAYTESYAYNDLGQLASLTYPTGFSVDYNYNDNYYLSEVKRGDDNSLIWTTDAMSALGQLEGFTLGNGLKTTQTFSKGFITSINTSNHVQDYTYTWDVLKGNLTSRTDGNNIESFTYDDLNRLTEVWQNEVNTATFSYSDAGNITNTSVVGKYDGYAANRVLSTKFNESSELDASFFNEEQVAEYTSFDKLSKITEGVNTATMTYGVAHEKIKMTSSDGSNSLERIYACGNYEVETGSNNRKLHYISTPNGVSAMYVLDNNSLGKMYYFHKDHLGSLTEVTDKDGQIVEENSYDAWGRRRNPDDWTYDNIPSMHITDHGFTGHEHMDAFSLINMKGRIYDPVIGRFLSPDRYVQAPTNTQSYNRYSYCMNNPLNATDPTGWISGNTSGGAGETGYSMYDPRYDMYGRLTHNPTTGMYIPAYERGPAAVGYGNPGFGSWDYQYVPGRKVGAEHLLSGPNLDFDALDQDLDQSINECSYGTNGYYKPVWVWNSSANDPYTSSQGGGETNFNDPNRYTNTVEASSRSVVRALFWTMHNVSAAGTKIGNGPIAVKNGKIETDVTSKYGRFSFTVKENGYMTAFSYGNGSSIGFGFTDGMFTSSSVVGYGKGEYFSNTTQYQMNYKHVLIGVTAGAAIYYAPAILPYLEEVSVPVLVIP